MGPHVMLWVKRNRAQIYRSTEVLTHDLKLCFGPHVLVASSLLPRDQHHEAKTRLEQEHVDAKRIFSDIKKIRLALPFSPQSMVWRV